LEKRRKKKKRFGKQRKRPEKKVPTQKVYVIKKQRNVSTELQKISIKIQTSMKLQLARFWRHKTPTTQNYP
jgi:hypothetical protein